MPNNIHAFAVAALLAIPSLTTGGASAAAQSVDLYKDPLCGCCEAYADYLRQHGYSVDVHPTPELAELQRAAGVPDGFQGCHLSKIEGYVVSGHVPVATIARLLGERPDITGITLPGMPQGSPGMNGSKTEPFTIHSLGANGVEKFAVE